jgi:pilus assembly protein TadC
MTERSEAVIGLSKGRVRLVAVTVGVSMAVTVGGRSGLVVGPAASVVLWWLLPRLLAAAAVERLRRAATDLPAGADLLAAALRSGAPPGHAAAVVGAALGGPVGSRLARVGHALRLGESPEHAWAYVADLPGGERVARAAVRSADSGAALAAALTRLAGEMRAARAAAADAAARRAGVLVVLPLGLCFLPAFLLAGVVPVVIAVLDGVLG